MNELIKVNFVEGKGEPSVNGRELHEALKIKTEYVKWFERMCEYGFEEGIDFWSKLTKIPEDSPGRPRTEHDLSLDMAKELCMIQRNGVGKKFRKYFIECERNWREQNTPKIPTTKIELYREFARQATLLADTLEENQQLKDENVLLVEKVEVMEPRVHYLDLITNSEELMTVRAIAKDYGFGAAAFNQLLREHRIQYQEKLSGQWLVYAPYQKKGYVQNVVSTFDRPDGTKGTRSRTKWTHAGREFLYHFLKKHGILPVCEQEEQC